MEKEERLRKSLHRLLLYSVKVVPVVIAGLYVLNTVLSYYDIDLTVLSYVVQYLFILYMYLSSLAFGFCKWHRICIHYVFVVLTLNIIDYHFGIPLSNRELFLLYGIVTGIALFGALYFKFRKC